jgi:hypothetical protein
MELNNYKIPTAELFDIAEQVYKTLSLQNF